MYIVGFRYSLRKMEAAAQDRAGWSVDMVCGPCCTGVSRCKGSESKLQSDIHSCPEKNAHSLMHHYFATVCSGIMHSIHSRTVPKPPKIFPETVLPGHSFPQKFSFPSLCPGQLCFTAHRLCVLRTTT